MPSLSTASFAGMIRTSIDQLDSDQLARHFSLKDQHANLLWNSLPPLERDTANDSPGFKRVYGSKLKAPWSELLTLHTLVLIHEKSIMGTGFVAAYTKQHELVNTLLRWLLSTSVNNGWCLRLLYVVCTDLKRMAELADAELRLSIDAESRKQGTKRLKLEEASRLLQKCFSACLNDRAPDVSSSRKMGVYFMASLLFKTYFRLSSTSLSTNLIRGIKAAELTDFKEYPRADRVTYTYYLGVFAFLKEQFDEAEVHFRYALENTYKLTTRNIKLILDYLIPLLLRRGVFPSRIVYRMRAPCNYGTLYQPFALAFKRGDVNSFDLHLGENERVLMMRNTYLIVERAREGAVRSLMKKAWIFQGKPGRVTISNFLEMYRAGSGDQIELDEMECILANLIFKGLMKGYISHEHQLVVLSKDKPFPWYPPFDESLMTVGQKEARNGLEMTARKKITYPPPVAS